MFLVYPLLAVASVLFAALTMVLAPVLALTADAGGNLPGALRLFQTFDATLDAGWRDGYFGTWKADGTAPAGWRLWWLRARWLWRNPGYTFDYQVLGCAFDSTQWAVRCCKQGESGNLLFFATGPLGRFNWTGRLGSIQWKLGWKAWNMWDSANGRWSATPWGTSWRVPLCATLSR